MSQITRQIYSVQEHSVVDIPISELLVDGSLNLYSDVVSKGFFDIRFSGTEFVFQAGGYVGLIPVNDRVAIDVQPKVPVRNLERILRISDEIPLSLESYSRDYGMSDEEFPSLLDYFAHGLIASLKNIELHGLYKTYERVASTTSNPSGRIDFISTIRRLRSRGIRNQVVATKSEQTTDTALNRCLKYAIWYLLQRYRFLKPRSGMQGIINELSRADRLFDRVKLDESKRFLQDRLVDDPEKLPTIRDYYGPAIYLAKAIIRDRGITFDEHEDIELASLLVNMDRVFEAFLRIILTRNLAALSTNVTVFDGNISGEKGASKPLFDPGFHEDIASNTKATPDIVAQLSSSDQQTNVPSVVIDVKYKAIHKIPDRLDINQIVTYGASYRTEAVMIVHPRIGDRRGLYSVGRIGTLRVYQYIFDLFAENLEDEEAAFAKCILHLLQPDT